MRFLQQRKTIRSWRASVLAVAVLTSAFACAVIQPIWLSQLTMRIMGGLAPVQSALAGSADAVRLRLTSRETLEADNRALAEENTKLRLRVALYDETKIALDRLMVRFGHEVVASGTLAHVIAAPSRSPYDVFIVDVGARQGVSVGDDVWFDTTVALGVVELVSDTTSRVRLYSSPGVETMVSIGTTSTALFTAGGFGGGAFEVKVPKEIEVVAHDALLLPSGQPMTLGFVSHVVGDDADSFKTVYATTPVNIFETREVLIRPRM